MKQLMILCTLFIVAGCGSSEIAFVKAGTMSKYSTSLTVGQAFDGWSAQECTNKEWSLVTTQRGEQFVQFTCDLQTGLFKVFEPDPTAAPEFDEVGYKEHKAVVDAAEQIRYSLSQDPTNGYTEAMRIEDSQFGAGYRKTTPYQQAQNALNEASNAFAPFDQSKRRFDEYTKRQALRQKVIAIQDKLLKARVIVQFVLNTDGTTFKETFGGVEGTFEDGKTATFLGSPTASIFSNVSVTDQLKGMFGISPQTFAYLYESRK